MILRVFAHLGLSLLAFLVIDLLWLGIVAKSIYGHHLGHLMRPTVHWPAALTFYALFVGGLVVLAVYPALDQGGWTRALLIGLIYGFLTYMTYELTNWAVLKDWPAGIVAIDIAWGTILGGAVATASFWIGQWLGVEPPVLL